MIPKPTPITPTIRGRVGETWLVVLNGIKQVVEVNGGADNSDVRIYGCGDDQGWQFGRDIFTIEWVRRIRL